MPLRTTRNSRPASGRGTVTWSALTSAAGGAYLAVLAVNRSVVVVAGPSMRPSLWPGDRLVTLPAVVGSVRPGRVVVVRDPADPGHLVVKRVVRVLAGGEVEVLGDAPEVSTDSRTWGALPRSAVARVVVRRWPDLRTPLHRADR